jgi:DHA2 family multidrug resistance protein
MTTSSANAASEGPASTMTAAQRYLTLATVVLGSSLYGTALLTTSTILPQMQGALSATPDEIAWAMTFNILATAVVTPMTGWLVSRFGTKRRRRVYSIALHALQHCCVGWRNRSRCWCCGASCRGAGAGAPVVPLSQSILFDTLRATSTPW